MLDLLKVGDHIPELRVIEKGSNILDSWAQFELNQKLP